MIPACCPWFRVGNQGMLHVKTGNDKRLGYSGGVSSPQGKLGEPTSVSWEPIYRAQYRHPPLGGSWNSRRGHPPSERWVHYRTCGERRCFLSRWRPGAPFFLRVASLVYALIVFGRSHGAHGDQFAAECTKRVENVAVLRSNGLVINITSDGARPKARKCDNLSPFCTFGSRRTPSTRAATPPSRPRIRVCLAKCRFSFDRAVLHGTIAFAQTRLGT